MVSRLGLVRIILEIYPFNLGNLDPWGKALRLGPSRPYYVGATTKCGYLEAHDGSCNCS